MEGCEEVYFGLDILPEVIFTQNGWTGIAILIFFIAITTLRCGEIAALQVLVHKVLKPKKLLEVLRV